MGLINASAAASAASAASVFEEEEATVAPATTAATPAASAAAPAAAPVPASAQAGALTLGGARANPFDALKNALPVEYNTLAQLTANQGNLIEREGNVILGDTADAEVLSWQDSFVVSPNDDKAPKDLVRYSADGVLCNDGTPCMEHVKFLQGLGYKSARVNKRAVIVMAIIKASKTDRFNGTLMQMDIAPSSLAMWTRYQANATWRGLQAQEAAKIRLNTVIKSGNGKNWTVVEFNHRTD